MSLHELLDLVFRWVHLIAGIMWIGNSLLFNWLDRNLVKPADKERKGFEGEIWLLHSGGFYQVEKKMLEPNQLPAQLHWFKWQNGFTWMSGICLLVIVYWMNDGAFLLDPSVSRIGRGAAIGLSVGLIVGAWLVYDLLWRTLGPRKWLAGTLSLALLVGVSLVLTHTLSGRAAYIHVGVLLGTLMTGNVWLVILPSQRELVAATKAGREQDRALSLRAKERSIHNNYMTFPLLFIMLSNHFPSTYGSDRKLAILFVLMVVGAAIRHFMNIRFWLKHWLRALWVAVGLGVFYVVLFTEGEVPAAPGPVTFAAVTEVITHRCLPCHSRRPTDPQFPVAPANVAFDTPEQIRNMAPRIRERAVVTKTMPLANKTEITDGERGILARWVKDGAELR